MDALGLVYPLEYQIPAITVALALSIQTCSFFLQDYNVNVKCLMGYGPIDGFGFSVQTLE